MLRAVQKAKEKGSSISLSVIPLEEQGLSYTTNRYAVYHQNVFAVSDMMLPHFRLKERWIILRHKKFVTLRPNLLAF